MRVSFARNSAGAPEITGTNNYYPFGLNHIGGGNMSSFSNYHSYKFGGKELQETGMYDFGARMYMPDLGRWGVIDPMAEAMRRYSPYNYAFNNPISFIDPDGMQPRQFAMISDARPDATSGWINPGWLGRGGGAEGNYEAVLGSDGGGGIDGVEYYEGEDAVEKFKKLMNPDYKPNFSRFNFNYPPDDHFNQFGQFLYTDNKISNNIVIDFQNPITGGLNTAPWLSAQLKDYYFDKDNFFILQNIAKYYSSAAGVDLKNLRNGQFSGSVWNGQQWIGGQPDLKSGTYNTFNGGSYSYKGVMSTIKENQTVNITVTNGHINSFLNNKYNFISTLEHEGGKISHLTVNMKSPIDNSATAQRNEHLILYKNQINSPIFRMTTLQYQKLILNNYKDVKNGATGN
ncbi:RHS repeat-associated core domain-containing protein [Chryseobacterium phosphatilyticum]|uniref:RHS repeat-associated core domain-containing protein n=1 Tax=Chryseobacterium phosphatilyticum TaxID=475075 RepID=UPI001E643099|nr:RHS repeat-associated core domain-containing protein [Chryseobacterium phosphatilyticum]